MLRRATQTTRGRLALLLSAVAVLMVGSAAADHILFDRFDSFGEALWSALLHLLDPSSLHEDEGAAERTIGIVQVVTGLVLLVGVLFTLVADTVGRSIERLGTLDPPVRARDHLLVVGAIDVLGEAVAALRWAAELGDAGPLVVLAPEYERPERPRILEELRERTGSNKVELVFGDTAAPSGFERAAAERARTVVIVPAGGAGIAETADVEVMQMGLALQEYLSDRGGDPQVRLLFRRGRNVDAVWEMFPSSWDAVVGDRVVAAVLRMALTGLDQVPEIEAIVDPEDRADPEIIHRARAAAREAGRRMRLTIVGCGPTAPALMEDLAAAGDEIEPTMLADRASLEQILGRRDPSELGLAFRETTPADPVDLGRGLEESSPDAVLVASRQAGDAGTSDAEATLTLLQTLRAVGADTPVLVELLLPESVERLPSDPRIFPISSLRAVGGALALTITDPERSQAMEREIGAPGT